MTTKTPDVRAMTPDQYKAARKAAIRAEPTTRRAPEPPTVNATSLTVPQYRALRQRAVHGR
ncbi:MAG: hypothetical protein P4L96_13650 [Rhodoferax sp.]|nr:hypothetical protein [Rhodoferax sp.]